MPARRARTLALFGFAVVYTLVLGLATKASLGPSASARDRPDGWPRIVLSPVEVTQSGEPRTVDTRVGAMHVRRVCSDGRCELLAGEGQGYALLASYPADRYVELEGGPRVLVRSLGEVETERRARLEARPTSPAPWWMITGLLGFLTLVVVLPRWGRLEADLEQIARGRPAIAEGDGSLTFLDDALPRTARTILPCAPGPVTALFQARTYDQTAYRGGVAETWYAMEGERDALVAGHGRAIGIHVAVLVWLATITVAGVGAALLG